MTKVAFNSIWGDIPVKEGSIIKSAHEEDEDELLGEESDEESDEEDEDDDSTDFDDSDESDESDDEESGEDDEEEVEDEYEYSDKDVSKAFAMLEEEGVLDLGDDDEFDATPQGLADAIATTVRNKLAKELSAIPAIVGEFYTHINAGGSVKNFKPEVSSSWEEFEMTSEEDKEHVLRVLYKSQGMSQEEIDEELEDIKDADKLDKKSEKALEVLKKQENELKEKQKEFEEREAKLQTESQAREISDLKRTIDTSKDIAGFELNAERKAAFKDYIFKVNPRTGKTQMQENMASEDRRLTIAFLDFINYTKADVVREVTTKLSKDRKKKLVKYTDKNMSPGSGSATVKTKTSKQTGSIQFPSMFGTHKVEVED